MRGSKVCTVGDCGRAHYAKGLCHAHYQRSRLGIAAEAPIRRRRGLFDAPERCGAPKCLLDAQEGSYCALHARRLLRGQPLDTPPRNGRHLARKHAVALFNKGHLPAEIADCFGVGVNFVTAQLLAARVAARVSP